MENYKRVFITLSYLTYILFGIIYLFSWEKGHEYLENIHFFLKLYVSLLLIYFFHPFRKIKFDHFHREVIFHAALFLLFSFSISAFIFHVKSTKRELEEAKKVIKKEVEKQVTFANELGKRFL
jgi:hypothetical protein